MALGGREFLKVSFSLIKLGISIPKIKLSKRRKLKAQNALKILNKMYIHNLVVQAIYCSNSAAVNLQWRFLYLGDSGYTQGSSQPR